MTFQTYNYQSKQKVFQLTWFLSGFFMTQLPQIITSTRVHGSIIQNKYSMSESTSYISNLFVYKKVTFSGLQYNFFINSTQTQLSKRSISPAQHVCDSSGLPVSIKNSLLKHWQVGGVPMSEKIEKSQYDFKENIMYNCSFKCQATIITLY